MAKQKRSVQKRGQDIHLSEEHDDSLLPSAETIQQYANIDKRFVDHILEGAKKEQEHRHKMSRKAMRLSGREQLFRHGLNFFAVLGALAVFGLGMYYSTILMLQEKYVAGTIFGGGIMFATVRLFMALPKRNTPG